MMDASPSMYYTYSYLPKFSMIETISVPMRFCASCVAAPMCGVQEIMHRNNLTSDDVNWIIPHEANRRIIEAVAKRAEISMDKVIINIDHYGNTSAATIPLAMWDSEKNLKKGDNIIFTAFGAGFVHGASFYKWGYDGDSVK